MVLCSFPRQCAGFQDEFQWLKPFVHYFCYGTNGSTLKGSFGPAVTGADGGVDGLTV